MNAPTAVCGILPTRRPHAHAALWSLCIASLLFCSTGSDAAANAHAASAADVRHAPSGADLRLQLALATGAAPSSASSASLTASTDEIFWYGFEQCGNGVIDPSEQCDRSDLGGATCQSQGFGGGTLGCDQSCHFDVSQCTAACSVALCTIDADCGAAACGPCFEGICIGFTP